MDATAETAPVEPPAAVLARIPDVWGPRIDCGPGWYPIIERLDAALAALDPGYVVLQVKEKFGGLRYYWEPSDGGVLACCAALEAELGCDFGAGWEDHETGDEHRRLDAARLQRLERMNEAVRQAEAEAARTCELTGGPGVLMVHNRWYRTLDPDHAGPGWSRTR